MTEIILLTEAPHSTEVQSLKAALAIEKLPITILPEFGRHGHIEPGSIVLLHWSRTRTSGQQHAHLVGVETGRTVWSVKFGAAAIPARFKRYPLLDLAGWDGSQADLRLVPFIEALRTQRASTPRRVQLGRRLKRAFAGVGTLAIIGLVYSFTSDFLQLQDSVCSIAVVQPTLSDTCGYLGFGGKPSREERLAWADRLPGSCEALRSHIDRFPEGAFRDDASEILSARRITTRESWSDDQRRLPLYVIQDGPFAANEKVAQNAALLRASQDAERLCSGFATTASFKYESSQAESSKWNCTSYNSGHVCGLEGWAICNVKVREVTETESCDP